MKRHQGRMREVLQRVVESRKQTLREGVTPRAADVSLANGARIAIRKTRDDAVALLAFFAGGAPEESASSHGATAILAHATLAQCGRDTPRGLRTSALVDANGWGLIFEARSRLWPLVLDTLTDCLLHTRPSDSAVERSRLGQLQALQRDPSLQLASYAARLLLPHRPGVIAPQGSMESLVNLDSTQPLAMRSRTFAAQRVTVSVVGNVDVARSAEQLRRRLTQLPQGNAYSASPPSLPSSTRTIQLNTPAGFLRKAGSEPPLTQIMIAFAGMMQDEPTAMSEGAMRCGALAMKRLGARFEASPGLRFRWSTGGAWERLGWGAVVIEADHKALEQLPDTVEEALASTPTSVEGTAETLDIQTEDSGATSHAVHYLRALAGKRPVETLGQQTTDCRSRASWVRSATHHFAVWLDPRS